MLRNVPSPQPFLRKQRGKVAENSIFFKKRPQTRERIAIVLAVPSIYELFDEKYYMAIARRHS